MKDAAPLDVISSARPPEDAIAGVREDGVVFKVARGATKPQIKRASRHLLGLEGRATVDTRLRTGKVKGVPGRFAGRRRTWKKAVVTLARGRVASDMSLKGP